MVVQKVYLTRNLFKLPEAFSNPRSLLSYEVSILIGLRDNSLPNELLNEENEGKSWRKYELHLR